MDSVTKVEFSSEELLEQNRALSEELAQCQSDKAFVWNLWKSLQVEKPELTSIVDSVIEREQLKSDAKDLKVLNVLQQKDQQIKTLQEIAADLQLQLKEANSRLSDLLVEESEYKQRVDLLEKEKDDVEAQLKTIEDLLGEKTDELELIIPENKELKSVNKALIKRYEQLCRDNDQQYTNFQELEEKAALHENEISKLKKNLSDEEKTGKELNKDLDSNLKDLQQELNHKIKEFDELQETLEVRDEQIREYLTTIHDQNEQLRQADVELSSYRKELEEKERLSKHVQEQCELIKNLEELQDETQKVITKQQDNHQNEIVSFQKTMVEVKKKNERLQRTCDKLMSENKKLNNMMSTKIEDIEELSNQIRYFKQQSNMEKEHCDKCMELQAELTKSRHQFNELLTKLEPVSNELSAKNEKDNDWRRKQKEIIHRQYDVIQSLSIELQTTRSAHQQRLDRFKELKKNHGLVLQQLSTYEEGSVMSPKQEEKPIRRASQRSLQHEESKNVWNELEYYKREYQQLKKERPHLTEELDELRVQTKHDVTKINNMKLRLVEMNTALEQKENELENTKESMKSSRAEDIERAVATQTISLESQIEIWRGKVAQVNIELNQLQEKYMQALQEHEDDMKRTALNVQTLENRLNKTRTDEMTQTDELPKNVDLLNKMDQVLEFVSKKQEDTTQDQSTDRLTISKLENSLTEKHSLSFATQTTPRLHHNKTRRKDVQLYYNEQASQTETTEATDQEPYNQQQHHHLKSEKTKRKEKLNNESQRLLLMRSELAHENRSLKKRVFSLESQVSELKDSRQTSNKNVHQLEIEREKLQSELVGTLQKLQATREILRDRSLELENCTKELQSVIKLHTDEDEMVMELNDKIKTLRHKMKQMTMDNSQSTIRLNTLEHENILFTQKLKESQERVVKLEKLLDQKKTFIEELKERCSELKLKLEKDKDHKEDIEMKLKTTQDREQKHKLFLDQLKKKFENLKKENLGMKENLSTLQEELVKKSRLLGESQKLCKNAESAITEMEESAYQQFKLQHEALEKKLLVVKNRYDKVVVKCNEMKLSIINFSDIILSQIEGNRTKLIAKKREENHSHENMLVNGEAFDIACSILNMTSSDLQDFLNDDSNVFADGMKNFNINEIKEKLMMILESENHFTKILTQYLSDLVNYNCRIFKETLV